jgi:hypothetical protein
MHGSGRCRGNDRLRAKSATLAVGERATRSDEAYEIVEVSVWLDIFEGLARMAASD